MRTEGENSIDNENVHDPFLTTTKMEKKHRCTYSDCDAVFLRPSRLQRHMRVHTGEKPYKCTHEGCNKAYTNASHLKRHMETHTSIKKMYMCSKCPMMISNLHNLKRHIERMHNNKDRSRLCCQYCKATFKKLQSYEEHIAAHNNTVVLYECKECLKSFTTYSKFKKHELCHNKKRHTCKLCNEVLDKDELIIEHLRIKHADEHTCKQCNRTFRRKRCLEKHQMIHETEAYFTCPYEECHRIYSFKRNLHQHILTNHLGHKFICDLCNAKISSKQRLADHIQKIHNSERVKKAPKTDRKKRKDAGQYKKSMVSKLIGLELPMCIEKAILQRKPTKQTTNPEL